MTDKQAKQKIFENIARRMMLLGKNGGRQCSPIGLMFGYQYDSQMDDRTARSLMNERAMRKWKRQGCTGLVEDLQDVWDISDLSTWGRDLRRIAERHDLSPLSLVNL